MQQTLTALGEERQARADAAHMERMRRKAAENRAARKRQAAREEFRQAKRDLREATKAIERLEVKYDRALRHPQMKDLELIGAQLRMAIATKRQAERRLGGAA